MPSDAAVELDHVSRSFGSGETAVHALRDVNLRVDAGRFLAVMGPSGSGKSTLLHVAGGLIRPSRGRALVEGRDLSQLDDEELTILRRRRIGFVFQSFHLLPILNAEENVSLPLVVDGRRKEEAEERTKAVLDLVGLAPRRGHLPSQLSGGEQQRVAIARAIVMEPALILADEPTGNLDSDSSHRILRLLRALRDERGQTILMVTHDANAAALADGVIFFRDGTIVQDGM